ncbi:DUF3127 domain-containing protein [Siphonobacter sp. SORGH_AS_0500]|uniref:DUF3127 domain-containing protein n=1 Tax=Siphonobacter sp. SORGH_AS_0500 TaxID=1864824 RepID=UPI002859DB56|nr:DUF3127 domain-containing protein [Siphonobacter sp. SORGH_AS_0500]MDR6195196.1 hypothetical protein [Siphonobacter sp. SORGH_AS_0500]
MEQLAITGKFLGAGNAKEVGTNGLIVREFWLDITDNPDWPNTPEFQLKGDKVTLVDNLVKGQQIKVTFRPNGRKFTRKDQTTGIITTLDAWKIEVISTQSAAIAGRTPTPSAQPTQTQPVAAGNDDLPF